MKTVAVFAAAVALAALSPEPAVSQTANEIAECINAAKAAGTPRDVAEAMYLFEWNNPIYFASFACAAKQGGAKYTYGAGNWRTSESFTLKGKQKLQVFIRRTQPEGLPVMLLVPVAYEVDGKRWDVSRQNLGLLAHYIRTAGN
jgi:hypothetical protein